MLKQSKPIGWGNEEQTAHFFGLTRADVRQLADSGEWPFVTVHGKRLFDVDELLQILAHQRIGGESDVN